MINKIFIFFFSDVGLPSGARHGDTHFRKKFKVRYFSKSCLHGVAYDLERLLKNFSDIFGQPKRCGRVIPIFRTSWKFLHHTYFSIKSTLSRHVTEKSTSIHT